jgi:hypothetical protein
MSRAAYMLLVGRTDHFPTEAQWEDAIDALRKGGAYGATDVELLRTEADQQAIWEWVERPAQPAKRKNRSLRSQERR